MGKVIGEQIYVQNIIYTFVSSERTNTLKKYFKRYKTRVFKVFKFKLLNSILIYNKK